MQGRLLDTTGRPMEPRGPYRAEGRFLRPDHARILQARRPVLRDTREDVRQAWERAVGHAVEFCRNSGFIAGAIDQCLVDTCGSGLRLAAQPDVEALGWSAEEASQWAATVEAAWRRWSTRPAECDLRGVFTIPQIVDSAVRWWFAYGEAIAILEPRRRPNATSLLKVGMIPPHRLVQETWETRGLWQGVWMDADGRPVGYRFKMRRPDGVDWDVDMPATDRRGRPRVVHVWDGDPGAVRGITPLAPVLKVVAQYDQLADATLTTTLLQTVFAASIRSSALSAEAFESVTPTQDGVPREVESLLHAKAAWWQDQSIDLGEHGRVNHLFPGEELEFHNAEHPGDNYLPFAQNLLREIARCIGVTFESLSLDYREATYSSVRMAISSIWPITMRRRERLAARLYQAIYEAWLDEEIGTGRIPFPGGWSAFRSRLAAATHAVWQGPARPTADDLKTAKAQETRLRAGITSLAHETAEYGLDVETVMRQRADDRARAERLGLPDPYAATSGIMLADADALEEDDA